MWARSLLLSAMIAFAAGVSPVAASQRGYVVQGFQPNFVMPAQDRGERGIISLREAVDSVRARYGGDLISARLEDGPRPVYVLRWRMPDGEVRDIRVPASR